MCCLLKQVTPLKTGPGSYVNFHPTLCRMIDAAEMGEMPGRVKWIPEESIDEMSASTHSLPLSMLASYLTWNSTVRWLYFFTLKNRMNRNMPNRVNMLQIRLCTPTEVKSRPNTGKGRISNHVRYHHLGYQRTFLCQGWNNKFVSWDSRSKPMWERMPTSREKLRLRSRD